MKLMLRSSGHLHTTAVVRELYPILQEYRFTLFAYLVNMNHEKQAEAMRQTSHESFQSPLRRW